MTSFTTLNLTISAICIAGDQFLTLIVGGSNDFSELKTPEVVVLHDGNNCSHIVPDLSDVINSQPSLILTPDQKIILCGGGRTHITCIELKNNKWEYHSSLMMSRNLPSAVSLKNGVFIFGGEWSKTTWEWLPT